MKTIYRYFAAVAILAAVSCTKQEETAPQGENQTGTCEFILDVTHEAAVKTSMDGVDILWNKDDQIGLSNYNYASEYGAQSIADSENYTPSSSAAFQIAYPETIDAPKVAFYPYNEKSRHTNGGSTDNVDACCLEIPAQQTGIAGNIPDKALAMVGKIADGACSMSNAGAVIKFGITYDNITSLRFEGNNSEVISGMRYYYAASGNGHNPGEVISSKDDANDVAKYVELVPSGEVFEPGDYYFVVGQNTLSNGFSITLTNSIGQKAFRKSTGEFKIERNHKYTNFGSDEGWFSDVKTGTAGNLGTADGTTATLYAIAPETVDESAILGFQLSQDNLNWSDYEGTITRRFSTNYKANFYTGQLSGIAPETTYYFRATYTDANGVTTCGKTKTFKTYANAHSAVIDICNGNDLDLWPFTNIACGVEGGLAEGTGEAAISKAEDLTLTTSSAESFVVNATNGVWINAKKGCLTMKVKKGDYIKFPVVEGKKPVCVTILFGNMFNSSNPNDETNIQGRPSVRKVSVVDGVETFEDTEIGVQLDPRPASIYDSHTWYLNNTDDGKYGIYFTRNYEYNCYISHLEVVYVDADQSTLTENLVWADGTGDHSNGAVITTDWPFDQGRSSWDSDNDYEFSVSDSFKYSFKSNMTLAYTRAGFQYGTSVGDYMAIKPSQNYKLTYIKLRGGNSANNYSVVDVDGNVVSGGGPKDMAADFDSILEFTLSGTTAGTKYRLQVNTTTKTTIREMWLTYELVE